VATWLVPSRLLLLQMAASVMAALQQWGKQSSTH
jgi:hypothetical protein